MENEIMTKTNVKPIVYHEVQPSNRRHIQYYSAYDNEWAGKLKDEFIAAQKDDRINTKRTISAGIAATARVQNQNDRVIAACENELHRKDLPEERRTELFEIMSEAAKATKYECAASREFQERHLDYSHKLPWKILRWGALILFGGIGGVALLKTTA